VTGNASATGASKVEVLYHQPEMWTAGYRAPGCQFSGEASSSLGVARQQGQWLLRGVIGAGGELAWDVDHGEQAVVVLAGSLVGQGRRIGAGGAVLLESGVPVSIGVVEDAEVVHFGAFPDRVPQVGPYGPPGPSGHRLHVLDDGDVPEYRFPDYETTGHAVRWYADSSCPTCRMTLLQPRCAVPRVSPSHTHTQDELIHVTRGALRVGSLVIGAGSTVCVPAEYRYGFRSDGPYEFLNYRSDASYQTRRFQDDPWLESAPVTTELVGRGR
jgi:hypothetical protein